MDGIPFVAIGMDEFKGPLNKGDKIRCPNCKKKHAVELGKDKGGKETNMVLFYKCGYKAYLAGIGGMAI